MTKQDLEFDEALFQKMEKAFNDSPYKEQVGEYWTNYVASIVSVINMSQLSGFGQDYYLTQGFGDALKYHAPRHRLRKLIPIPPVYRPIEKYLVIYNHRKLARTLFSEHGPIFAVTGDFASYLAKALHDDVKSLGISRFFSIGENKAPWRYWMFLVYLEMFFQLSRAHELSAQHILSGNYLDIGGGYGSSLDGIALLKKFSGFGEGTVNYDVDQFPVTFIANQYLKYRNPDGTLPPLTDASDLQSLHQAAKGNSHSYFRVIQNNDVNDISGLDVSFFFNSNSFQEMDVAQVEAYCRFMQRNKAQKAYLGAYYYDSAKELNAPAKSLDVLGKHFTLVDSLGAREFFEGRGGSFPEGWVVKGTYYLFDLSE